MTYARRQLLRYVQGHGSVLIGVLVLVGLVGILDAVSSVLLGPVFDAFLGVGKTPAIAIPLIGKLDFSAFGGALLLLLLVASTIARAASEYGAVTATACL